MPVLYETIFLFQVEVLKSLNINLEFLSSAYSYKHNVITSGHLRGSFDMANLGILEKGDDESDSEDYDPEDYDPESDEDKSVEAQERKFQIKRKMEFQKWLKRVFRPSNQHFFGADQLNPVLYFHLTKLSKGFVGGLINRLTYT